MNQNKLNLLKIKYKSQNQVLQILIIQAMKFQYLKIDLIKNLEKYAQMMIAVIQELIYQNLNHKKDRHYIEKCKLNKHLNSK